MGKRFINIVKKLQWRLLVSIVMISMIVLSGCNTSNQTSSNGTESAGVTTESTSAAIATGKANTALVSGTYEALSTDNEAVMAYSRSKDDETIYILHNLSEESVEVEISDVSDGEVLFNSNDSTKIVDKTVTLDRYSSIIIKK